MTTSDINIELTSKTTDIVTSSDKWLNLHQEVEKKPLTMGGIYEMWTRVKAGISARTYNPENCEVRFQDDHAYFKVYFNAYPSHKDLAYNLIASFGVLSGEKTITEAVRNFPVFFNNSDHVTFDRIYENISINPRTPCFSTDGTNKPNPKYSVDGPTVLLEDSVFWVLRGTANEYGFTHSVEFDIPLKDEDGNRLKVDSIDCTITASWNDQGEVETDQLTLEIPDCISNALTLCEGKPDLVCQKCGGTKLIVYFSTCDGEVLQTDLVDLYESDENRWCMAI